MSVIGPRPLLVEYLPYYTKEEHHRHDVKGVSTNASKLLLEYAFNVLKLKGFMKIGNYIIC